MADYYTHFSVTLPIPKDPELAARIPEDWLNSMADWDTMIKSSMDPIVDEYGNEVKWSELKTGILQREWHTDWDSESRVLPGHYKSEAELHRTNHSERGPHGLLRSKIDGVHCVGHDGMCDLIIGDFS